jgi:hypothetical protein
VNFVARAYQFWGRNAVIDHEWRISAIVPVPAR